MIRYHVFPVLEPGHDEPIEAYLCSASSPRDAAEQFVAYLNRESEPNPDEVLYILVMWALIEPKPMARVFKVTERRAYHLEDTRS